MEKMQGNNFFFVRKDMPEKESALIDTEIGKTSRELSYIQNSEF